MVVKKSSSFQFDAFAKPIDGVRNQTSIGGVITILASLFASLLFLSQLYLYFQVDVRQSFSLAPNHPLSIVIPTEGGYSNFITSVKKGRYKNNKKANKSPPDLIETADFLKKNRFDISVHITFPHVPCGDLDFAHNTASDSNGKLAALYGRNIFQKRLPTDYEWAVSNGRSGVGKSTKQRQPTDPHALGGCTVQGKITVPKISGDMTFGITMNRWQDLLRTLSRKMPRDQDPKDSYGDLQNFYNVSYYMHEIAFGEQFPKSENPLKNSLNVVDNGLGIAHTNIAVKLIPTHYKRFSRRWEDSMYQTSVAEYAISPQYMARAQGQILPGISIHYDFTPLAVHHVESRENIFIFLSSLISIVGGVFVTVSLVSGCLVNSAAAVGKKID